MRSVPLIVIRSLFSIERRKPSGAGSFNRCVALALQRGYSTSDLDGNREAVRNFVIKCMQGQQQ
jgi:hypothetical protein